MKMHEETSMPIGPLRAAALLVATLMVVVLTVNGGSSDQAKARWHSAYVYESTEPSGTIVSPRKEVFTGGLITGGTTRTAQVAFACRKAAR